MKGFYILILILFTSFLGKAQDDYTYKQFVNREHWPLFPQRADSLYGEFADSLNIMYDRDQLIRTFELAAKANNDSAQVASIVIERWRIDSLNYVTLTSLIRKYSYPTNYTVGNSMKAIGLLVVHSPEDVNDLFLEKYYELALNRKVEWFLPQRIEMNLLRRFRKDGYCFLKLLQLAENGSIEFIDKNFFEMAALAKTLRDNVKVDIELRVTSNLTVPVEKREQLLKDLADFLVSNKVARERVIINATEVVEDKYYNGKPLFAFVLFRPKIEMPGAVAPGK